MIVDGIVEIAASQAQGLKLWDRLHHARPPKETPVTFAGAQEWRILKTGPGDYKIGTSKRAQVLYHRHDLDLWMA